MNFFDRLLHVARSVADVVDEVLSKYFRQPIHIIDKPYLSMHLSLSLSLSISLLFSFLNDF
jgi:hypothetical protein